MNSVGNLLLVSPNVLKVKIGELRYTQGLPIRHGASDHMLRDLQAIGLYPARIRCERGRSYGRGSKEASAGDQAIRHSESITCG